MGCQNGSGQEISLQIDQLAKDVELLDKFVNGSPTETVPLGEEGTSPTETLRNLARQIKNAFNYWREKMESLEDPIALDSGIWNVRRSRVIEDAITAGGVLTLPTWYYPTRNIMFLTIDGLVYTPQLADNWDEGERQYTEIGTNPQALSNQVLVHCDVPAGSVVDVWVISSNLFKAMDELLASAEQARAAALAATQSEEDAAGFASAASSSAQAAANSAQAAAASATISESIASETALEEIANISNLDASVITSGIFDPARLPAATPTAHAGTHAASGADPVTAAAATKLATPQTITLSGAVYGSASFDGSSGVTIVTEMGSAGGAGSTVLRQTLTEELAAGVDFTVPAYVKGSGKLAVYYLGLLTEAGETPENAFYQEIGLDGESSSSIRFFDDLPGGSDIVAVSMY